MTNGQVAHDAYFDGMATSCHVWDGLQENERKCWEASAKAVMDLQNTEIEKMWMELRLAESSCVVISAFRDEWRELYRELKRNTTDHE